MEVGAESGAKSRLEGGTKEVEPDSCRLLLSYTKPCLNRSTIVGDSEKIGRRDTDADQLNMRWKEILIFKEDHIPRNPYTRSMGIVTNTTLIRDSITKKNTLNRLSSKFMSFMRREMHKTNTTKCMKIII